MIYWVGFIVCTGLIIYSGSRLSRYGDIIAEKLRLGRTWVGVVMIASATSLPELVTGITSVTAANAPDIAAGDVLGSCVFNLFILAGLDALIKDAPISSRAHQGNIISAGFGALLLGMTGLALFMGGSAPQIGWIGVHSLIFILCYLIGIRVVYTYEKNNIGKYLHEVAGGEIYKDTSAKRAFILYALNAAVIFAAAAALPYIGKELAKQTGVGESFVGNVLIAASTSLPEAVTSIAAVRMGAVDMAIGNIFGSNMFNIMILGMDDLFYFKGPLLASVSQSNIIPAFTALAMTSIAIVGLTYRREGKRLLLSWDSLAMAVLYVINLMLLYSVESR